MHISYISKSHVKCIAGRPCLPISQDDLEWSQGSTNYPIPHSSGVVPHQTTAVRLLLINLPEHLSLIY